MPTDTSPNTTRDHSQRRCESRGKEEENCDLQRKIAFSVAYSVCVCWLCGGSVVPLRLWMKLCCLRVRIYLQWDGESTKSEWTRGSSMKFYCRTHAGFWTGDDFFFFSFVHLKFYLGQRETEPDSKRVGGRETEPSYTILIKSILSFRPGSSRILFSCVISINDARKCIKENCEGVGIDDNWRCCKTFSHATPYAVHSIYFILSRIPPHIPLSFSNSHSLSFSLWLGVRCMNHERITFPHL